ncbi:hypothetical protein HispidOSU_008051, partial [Sigmodon hispidus]
MGARKRPGLSARAAACPLRPALQPALPSRELSSGQQRNQPGQLRVWVPAPRRHRSAAPERTEHGQTRRRS